MAMEMIAGMASTSGPTLTPWIPQDDLLLKNAIEAGASLEALAKGAVRFSRKYNINELRHRWKSLLYDPDVSVEASASMFSLELSATDSPVKTSRFGTKSNLVLCPLKRKLRTIRSQYNAMRKKICRQVLDSLDGVLDGMQSKEFMKEYGGSLQQNELCEDMSQIHGDNLVDCKTCSGIEEIGKSHAEPDMPIWMRVDGVSMSTMPLRDNLRNKVQIAKDTFIHPDELNGSDFVNHPESRIDLPNEEELLYMDVDGKDTIEKSCDDNLDSLLLSSPGDQEDNEPHVHQPPNLDSRDNIASSSNCTPTATMNAITDLSNPGHGDIINSVSHPELETQSFEAAKNLCYSELNDEYMFCTLNSEDTEIPCNDNIYPLSGTAAIYREASPLLLMSTNQQNNEPESLKEEDRTTWSFMASHICRSDVKPDVLPIGSLSAGVKTAILDRKHLMSVLRQGSNSLANQSQSRLADVNLETSSDEPAQQEEIGPTTTARELTKLEIGKCKTPHLEASSSSLEPEYSDSDDDVPYFDEVEAMILEMDLCPMDEDSHATEVSRYQHVDSKRTIMRLEQCGQSYIKRATASQGALAVLYGRHMKQYIKKSEVTLGRATEDIDVDIDLRREGPANKVSRKQALIKMEGNGSFLLKNLGKSSIFLNGNEVGPGQLLGLCSGSLIEIRDMAFIFEINDKSVRKFLENEAKRE